MATNKNKKKSQNEESVTGNMSNADQSAFELVQSNAQRPENVENVNNRK